MRIGFLGLGFQPKWRLDDIPHVPKVLNHIYLVFTYFYQTFKFIFQLIELCKFSQSFIYMMLF